MTTVVSALLGPALVEVPLEPLPVSLLPGVAVVLGGIFVVSLPPSCVIARKARASTTTPARIPRTMPRPRPRPGSSRGADTAGRRGGAARRGGAGAGGPGVRGGGAGGPRGGGRPGGAPGGRGGPRA